jgi:hypothetical protein
MSARFVLNIWDCYAEGCKVTTKMKWPGHEVAFFKVWAEREAIK